MGMIMFLKEKLNNLRVLTIILIVLGITSALLSFCHSKTGRCSEWFTKSLIILDIIAVMLVSARIILFLIELSK